MSKSKRNPVDVSASSSHSRGSADALLKEINGEVADDYDEHASNGRTNGRVAQQQQQLQQQPVQSQQQQQQQQQKKSIGQVNIDVNNEKIAAFKRRLHIEKQFKIANLVANEVPGGENAIENKIRYTIGTDSESKQVLDHFKARINGELRGDLAKVVPLYVKLVSYRNTLPTDIGVRILGIADVPAKEIDARLGTAYSIILPADSAKVYSKKIMLYNKSEVLNGITARNISLNSLTAETLNAQLFPVPDYPHLRTVYPGTEVGKILMKPVNREYLHIGEEMVSGVKNMLGGPLTIEKDLTDYIVQELVKECAGVKTMDLRTFGLEFCNLKDEKSSIAGWKSIASDMARFNEAASEMVMTELQTITAVVKIKYAIVSQDMIRVNQSAASSSSNAATTVQSQQPNPSAPP